MNTEGCTVTQIHVDDGIEVNRSTSRHLRRTIGGLTLALSAALGLACGGGGEGLTRCSDEPGVACNWAGVPPEQGYDGEGIDRRESRLNWTMDITFGPDGLGYLVDWNNHLIRRVEKDDTIVTVMGTQEEGDGPPGQTDRLPVGDPEGADALTVNLNHPSDVDFLPDGTLLLAAWHNNKVRTMDMDTGIVKVMTGNSYGYDGDGEEAYKGVCNQPKSVVADADGNVYFIDQRNERIRMIDTSEPRMLTTIAGSGARGYGGDGADALEATFDWDNAITPQPEGGLALDGDNLYIADTGNHRIRRLDLESGIVETIAGTGEPGYSGDGGDALEAAFNRPYEVEMGPDGRLWVVDAHNNAIRAIDLESGVVETVAGNGTPCPTPSFCYVDDHGADALDVQFSWPYGIGFDEDGHLYVADTYNSRVVRIAQ
jgi:sugar lactone lactonase YvrE